MDHTQARRHSAASVATLAAGVILLGAARPAGEGLRYDIKLTVTTVKAGTGQSTRAYDEGLAHAQVSGTKARIDVAKGPIGPLMDGHFLIIHDTTTLLFDPQRMQYAQVDPAKMMQGLNGVIGGLNAMMGVQATNIKVDETALGAGDQLGAYATLKYRITEDYTVSLNIMGMGSSMTGHTTTDYWYAQKAAGIINPFVAKNASPTQLPVNLGPQYAAQMTAARAKLPSGVPIKSVVTTVITDANGNRSTTTTQWEITNVAQAPIPDATFDIPSGYSQLTGADMLASMTGGTATSPATGGATGAAGSPSAAPTAATSPGAPVPTPPNTGNTSSGVGAAAAGAVGGVGNAAKQGAVSGVTGAVSGAASNATTNAVQKILHIP
jgi:hypothetical protein